MDFLTLHFGQLLHLLDNELENIMRNFDKKKYISAQYGIYVYYIYVNIELVYIYIYIYIYIHNLEDVI